MLRQFTQPCFISKFDIMGKFFSSSHTFCGARKFSLYGSPKKRPERGEDFNGMGPRSEKVNLKEALAEKIEPRLEIVSELRKDYRDKVIDQVTIEKVFGGMRNLTCMVYDTSHVDPEEGVRFRGYSIPEIKEKLPKCKEEPIPEALFWLLLTGDIPTNRQTNFVIDEWHRRGKLPDYIANIIHNFPCNIHPIAQFSSVMAILSNESRLPKALQERIPSENLWEVVYEDVMDLLAKLPSIAATIYQHTFKADNMYPYVDTSKDWARNLAHMMRYTNPEFEELMRMYLVLHSDHDGGDVFAHAVNLVGSAMTDCYHAYSAGLNSLAGRLFGLANEESLIFIHKLIDKVGTNPSDDQVKNFVLETLKTGVIPGFGHTVLRNTDPRYSANMKFGEKYLPDDPFFKVTLQLFRIVPPILQDLGKVSCPWPNVDANSGVLLQHYGMTDMSFYPILYGMSRALGTMAWYIWSKALMLPIERPRSYDTSHYRRMVEKGNGNTQAKINTYVCNEYQK